ncbi:MAG TPA: phosphatase PAP2 family protein [Mycobacteriales bacterium]|nr:phosphatase PAP2 family protein [Mycobacteriales bacterium]
MAEPRRRRPFALLPERIRAIRRPRWWQEVGFVLIVYYLYSLVRNAAPSHETAAFHRSSTVLSIERFLHVDIERSANHLVAGHSWLAYTCDYYYATLHFVVTIGVLVWLYVKHPLRYRSIRSVLIATNLTALLGFWFVSLAPPRMLPGFTDTLVKFHTWGSVASGDIAKESNQFAAMPSLHVGWALWCAIALVTVAERRWVRVLGAVYPLCTVFVVLGTANHYVMDCVGGVLALGIGILIERLLSGRYAYARRSPLVAVAASEPDLVAAA